MHVRETRLHDWHGIDALLKRARFASPALWPWQGHLTDRGFVVVEMGRRIVAALLVSAEDSPVAWVRLAAVGDELDIGQWLDISLPPLLSHLRPLDFRQLTWMDYGAWAGPSLALHGFAPLNEVITLTKTDRTMPRIASPAIKLRSASRADFGAIAAIDRRAFTATWWRSEASMQRRASMASRFTVAERDDEVIGYTERELHLPVAHLNRIAVDPGYHGQGIGAALLRRTLTSMWQSGASVVSLNTQRSNRRSRRLYDRFGFTPTGDSVTVWALRL